MKKKINIFMYVLLSFCLLFMSACSNNQSHSSKEPASKTTNAKDMKIVLILPGPINDQSWNATNYAGLTACNESLGTNMEYVENVQAADYEATFREYAQRGYDLIMAAGSQFDEAVAAVAPNYEKTKFCVVNGSKCDGDNIAPIFPKEYEASFLASIIAGNISENGQFATIGGFPNEPMEHLLDVYETNSVNIAKERGISDAKAVRAYANSWSDVSLGKQMAEQMIDNGADTLFVYANEVGLGAIEAAKAKQVKFIGFSGNQNDIDPDTVVASVVFDFKTFYIWAIQQFLDGSLSGNTVHEAGINENIFTTVYTQHISQEVKDKVEQAIREYKEGKIELKSMFAK